MPWTRSQIGYCSNVHAGEAASQVQNNLARYTAGVRQQRDLANMQHGLWLAEKAANQYAASTDQLNTLKYKLNELGLSVTTLNGFPLGNFHAGRVKEAVYLPHWGNSRRLEYTLTIANLLAEMLPPEQNKGSISTLPLGYMKQWTDQAQASALDNLSRAVVELSRLEDRSGKHIQLCLEMEPGCVLEETSQILALFEQDLPRALQASGGSEEQLHRYLGVCFDICHQAVMFEDIEQSLQQIHAANIQIGKIQISSALKVKQPQDQEVKAWLSDYAESRYLHQVTGRNTHNQRLFADDLVDAIQDRAFNQLDEWRIHFHVPVHQAKLGYDWAETTSAEIDRVFAFLARQPDCQPHLELETYTWEVLPETYRPGNDAELIKGLGAELRFIETVMNQHDLLMEQADA